MTKRRAFGYRPFWPDLEPRSRYGYCFDCRHGTLPNHESTREHRRRTRSQVYDRGSGDWLRIRPAGAYALSHWDEQYDEEEARSVQEIDPNKTVALPLGSD